MLAKGFHPRNTTGIQSSESEFFFCSRITLSANRILDTELHLTGAMDLDSSGSLPGSVANILFVHVVCILAS